MTPDKQRQRMVDEQLRRRNVRDARVLAAFAEIPREEFVLQGARDHAYGDSPLSIGEGQTISQPLVVAMTIELMQLQGHERVLEIGTGSGYSAALLAVIVREVVTIERIPSLASAAAERLSRLGYTNVTVHCGDGTLGWPDKAPYEAICVAAGAPRPPQPLLDQLAIGGRLVLPFGPPDHQRLVRIIRRSEVVFDEQDLGEVRFVPLVGQEGWPESKAP